MSVNGCSLPGTDEWSFRRSFLDSDDKTIQRRWSSYDSSLNLLLARLPTSRPHEIALHEFDTCLLDSIKPMGLCGSLRKFGSATVRAESGSSKQPDLQYLPKRLPPGRTKQWPTMAVEIAYSEATSKLLSDTRFWPHESGGDVQTVITITIGRSMPRIALESWELYDGRLKRQQVVSIAKGENQHVYLEDQPLVIGFEKLFLRLPEGPRETDIGLVEEALRSIAQEVWYEQGL